MFQGFADLDCSATMTTGKLPCSAGVQRACMSLYPRPPPNCNRPALDNLAYKTQAIWTCNPDHDNTLSPKDWRFSSLPLFVTSAVLQGNVLELKVWSLSLAPVFNYFLFTTSSSSIWKLIFQFIIYNKKYVIDYNILYIYHKRQKILSTMMLQHHACCFLLMKTCCCQSAGAWVWWRRRREPIQQEGVAVGTQGGAGEG